LIDLIVKTNNQSGTAVITDGLPVFSWAFIEKPVISIDEYGIISDRSYVNQASYRVKLGNSIADWGFSGFSGNVFDTGTILSSSRSVKFNGVDLVRGRTYYGQVKITDANGETSEWEKFSFRFNSFPSVSNVVISPETPSITNNLILNYTYQDNDGDSESGTRTRWFKNGVHTRQFDDQTYIDSSYLSYKDIWYVEVSPRDGYEYGTKTTSTSVIVQTDTPSINDVSILPSNPNVNDILKASYSFEEDAIDDKSLIRWYVNDILQSDSNDEQYVRLDLVSGDMVWCEVQPFNGVVYGSSIVSEKITILETPIFINDLRVDGKINPLDISSTRPVLSWAIRKPTSVEFRYISVRIGTFFGSDNIYSSVVPTGQTTFTIPSNLLTKGRDYFVSIAAGSSDDSFGPYQSASFRIKGSRWADNVSNSRGWTVDVSFTIGASEVFDEEKYQVIRIEDGSKFAEIRLYAGKIGLLSDELVYSGDIDMSGIITLTIVGLGSDIKIYVNRVLSIDGTGYFTQVTNGKKIEIGGVVESPLVVLYKTIYYTTLGFSAPGNEIYSSIQFRTLSDMEGNEAIGIESYIKDSVSYKIFATNPNDTEIGASLFKLYPSTPARYTAANRTFSPINKIKISSNGLYKVISHSQGATIFKSYLIPDWDYDLTISTTLDNPKDNNWLLVKTINNDTISITDEGLLINTTFENTGGRQIL